MKSGLLMGDLDVYERSRQGHTFPPFPALVIGSFGYLFGSIEAAWMFFKVLCPILIWMLIYLAMSRVSSNVWLGSLIAWAVVLISFGPRNALLIGAYAMYQPLDVTRLPQPAMSFVVLLLAIHLSAWALETRSSLALGFAGVVGSILFYTYYYYWICFFGGLSILMLVFIGLKRWRQSRDTFVILSVGGLLGAPYLYLVRQARPLIEHTYLPREVAFTTEIYLGAGVMFIIFASLLFFHEQRQWFLKQFISNRAALLISLCLATICGALAGMNLQVVTGIDAQHKGHFLNRTLQPIATTLIGLLLGALLEPLAKSKKLKYLCISIMSLLIFLAGIRQYQVGVQTAADHWKGSSRWRLLEWIDGNLPVDSVIGTSDLSLIVLIPLKGRWTFVPSGNRTSVSDDEILTRYLIASSLSDTSYSEIIPALQGEAPEDDRNWIYADYLLFSRRSNTEAFMRKSDQVWRELNIPDELKTRRLDYFITRNQHTRSLSKAFAQVMPLYSNEDWTLSRVTGPQ